jgi:26S proteasome regulatory subunit N7
MESLSAAFGVSVDFVDVYVLSLSLSPFHFPTTFVFYLTNRELSRFIAAGRLHASIDKVNGIVETTRPSRKNAQYETVVKKGDVLLGNVQRLSKVLY